MMKIYFGADEKINNAIKEKLASYKLDYQSIPIENFNKKTLTLLMIRSRDCFELLSRSLNGYKMDSRISTSLFIKHVISNVEKNIRLPIVETEKDIISGLTPEEFAMFAPKQYRKAEREFLFLKLGELDKGQIFWKNFELFRKQSELRWFELNELLFADVSDDLGEIKKAKDRFFSYKKNKQVPPDEIIGKILKIFLVDREDFFKKSPSDLQNF